MNHVRVVFRFENDNSTTAEAKAQLNVLPTKDDIINVKDFLALSLYTDLNAQSKKKLKDGSDFEGKVSKVTLRKDEIGVFHEIHVYCYV